MFALYTWRGKPIQDIEKWAEARGEKLVYYKETRLTPYGPEIDYGRMPESFWNSLLRPGNTIYEELECK